MRPLLLLRLALRNVRREARRSVLTSTAMALGIALLVFSRSLADGGHEDWINAGVRMGSGHVVLHAPGYLESAKLEDRLESDDVDRSLAAISSLKGDSVLSVVTRLSVNGLASSAASAVPVRIDGVDPASEPDFSFFPDKLQEGRFLEPGDRLSAFIGRGLAERLNLHIGSRFVVTAQSASGDVEGQLLRVIGIFRTGLLEADEGLIHIPLETARAWLGVTGGATMIGILLPDSRDVPAIQSALKASLGEGDVVVSTWREATPEIDAAVRVDDYGDYIFHAILFSIIALAVLNAVLMSVIFRRREFGVLQALGLSRLETGAQVMMEGLLLTALAGVVGVIFGVAVTWGFWRDGLDFSFALEGEFSFSGIVLDTVIVPEFRLSALIQSVYSVVIVGLIASIYPALHAMRIDIAEAMKFER
jgi:ABC-type lipoprotein release transport system permease subunit